MREYQEELGADTEQLIVLGRLTSIYVFASNFYVTPCVAIAPRTPKFDPNPHEVARVLELAVALLIDPRQPVHSRYGAARVSLCHASHQVWRRPYLGRDGDDPGRNRAGDRGVTGRRLPQGSRGEAPTPSFSLNQPPSTLDEPPRLDNSPGSVY